jgi:RNA polymerase sigma factor (sigma-70 family)
LAVTKQGEFIMPNERRSPSSLGAYTKRRAAWPEDAIYAQWQDADESQRSSLEAALVPSVRRHAEIVVWRKLREQNPDLVEEIVTGVFKHHLANFRGKSLFSTWVHSIALNKFKQELRSRRVRREVIDDATNVDDADQNRRLEGKPQEWIPSVDLDILRDGLSDEERILYDLKRKGMTDRQIASMLDKSPEAIESRLRRLIRKLQEKTRATRRKNGDCGN